MTSSLVCLACGFGDFANLFVHRTESISLNGWPDKERKKGRKAVTRFTSVL